MCIVCLICHRDQIFQLVTQNPDESTTDSRKREFDQIYEVFFLLYDKFYPFGLHLPGNNNAKNVLVDKRII
jgi:hypothetical protein